MHTATKALENLARRGALQKRTLPDQWYLLSLEKWSICGRERYKDARWQRLLEHARRLCGDMLDEQRRQHDSNQIRGCFTPEGRTCPTATRLEGLTAALSYLPQDDEDLREAVRAAIQIGLPFLSRSQIVEGPYAGALPRYAPGFTPSGVPGTEHSRLL